jgi:hypothetical protein
MSNNIKECSLCKGLGYFLKEKEIISCDCILVKKARDYLGPMYQNYPYSNKIQWDKFRNFLGFVGFNRNDFKSLVKSFLLSSGLKLKHISTTPLEIIDAYFDYKENDIFKELSRVDFLIIYFGPIYKNKWYDDCLYSILDRRILYNRKTWIHTESSFSNSNFIETYSEKVCSLITSNFLSMSDSFKEVKFNKGIKK